MRNNEEDEYPHQPEMPHTCSVIPSKGRSQPVELHGFVNRPTGSDQKEPGDRNREVCCALKCVVLCVDTGMQPFAACQLGEGNAHVVPNHLERVKQIGPARHQGPPSSSKDQPYKVYQPI